MTYHLDIKKVLNELMLSNIAWFKQLSDEERKSLSPLILMQWLSGTNNSNQILKLNELVNPVTFLLQNHKGLLIKLLMCSVETSNCSWLSKGKKLPNKKINLVSKHLNISRKEALEYLPLLTENDIIDMAQSEGLSLSDIKKIIK